MGADDDELNFLEDYDDTQTQTAPPAPVDTGGPRQRTLWGLDDYVAPDAGDGPSGIYWGFASGVLEVAEHALRVVVSLGGHRWFPPWYLKDHAISRVQTLKAMVAKLEEVTRGW